MSHKNLELTEKAITRHTKRLQKELSKINHNLKLSEAQNMLSRILGMKDFHELKKQFNFDKKQDLPFKFTSLDDYLKIENFVSLEKAEENLAMFFKNGDISIILEFLNSEDEGIKIYIQNNVWELFNIAAANSHIYLIKLLIDRNLIDVKLFKNQIFERFITDCFVFNNEIIQGFSYVFFDLNIPNKISKEEAGQITHYLVQSKNLKILKQFLKDKRVGFQKNFYWNKLNNIDPKIQPDLSYCALNTACLQGSMDIVKYLIEEEKLIPFSDGSTVRKACISGEIELVQYLINEQKAPFIFFKANTYPKFEKNNLTSCIDSYLDFSTLSGAVSSSNTELVNYLIKYKGLNVSDYDYLAVRTALIDSSSCYSYFFKDPESLEYIKNNAQKILDLTILKKHFRTSHKLKENQFYIARELLRYSKITSDENIYHSDNHQLIVMLENHYNQSAKYKSEVISDQDT